MSKKVAVILSGCGVYDGAEAYEAVLTFLYIEEQGASYQTFAPNIQQHHVINHINGSEMNEQRNVLTEAARLVRGNIQDLQHLNVDDFDALIIPGGFGVAKNLSDFALKGKDYTIQTDCLAAAKSFQSAKKPIGLMCIAPAIAASIFGDNVEVTIGNDAETISAIEASGAKHIECDVYEAYIDEKNLLVSSPAFMLAESVSEAAPGIELLVKSVIDLCH